MSDSQIEEIKNKLNILDVVGSYIKLTKTGINYRGVCPFHAEKTPSFFVTPIRQMWHCFGCGAGSSMFDFVMKIEGVEFGDALKILANKAGVVLKRENSQLRTERQRLYEILDLTCLFFEKQLEGSVVGKEAEVYLVGRGITKDSIKKWRLGYSPDSWNSLTDFLISKGYTREEVVKAGLAIEKDGSTSDSYDRFRGRIMFPVFDLNSAPVGFGGRVFSARGGSALGGKQFDQNIAKYINTPQTLLYDKSGVLYGLNNGKVAIRKNNQCVVTEGYTDVIMCHQAGFENTVASSGTALTERHLAILKRYTENLILAFDMDVAGDSATKRGINLAESQGFTIRIIEHYGEGAAKSDPADIILKDPKIWEESLTKSKSIMDYYFDSAFIKFDKNTPEGKKEIGKVVLPAIHRMQNKIEQSHWVQKLSQMLGVKEEVVIAELSRVIPERNFEEGPVQKAQATPITPYNEVTENQRKKLIEEKIMAVILKNPDYVKILEDDVYRLFSGKISIFLKKLKKIIDLPADQITAEEEPKDVKTMFDTIIADDGEFKNFVAALILKGESVYDEDGEEEIKLCISQLKNIELKGKLNKISDDIKAAEGNNDAGKVSSLMQEFNNLAKEL